MEGSSALVLVGLIALAIIVALAFRGTETQRLRRAWFRRTRLPRPQADAALARHLQALQERFPGRTEAWYLKKILADLHRDQR